MRKVIVSAILALPACVMAHAQLPSFQPTVAATEIQRDGAVPAPESSRISKDVDEVTVVFAVRDRWGRLRTDLTQDQIKLRDNDRSPAKINYFESQSDLPLSLVFLIDVSGSMRSRFKDEKKAAIQFLREVIRPGKDEAMIASFQNRVDVIQGFTDNMGEMEKSVNELTIDGGSAVRDSIRWAADRLFERRGNASRRAIVIISDGQDNSSRTSENETVEHLLRAESVVFVFSTNAPNHEGPLAGLEEQGDSLLRSVAKSSGGRVIRVAGRRQLHLAFKQLQRELRSQYVLTYKPSDFVADDSYHAIHLGSTLGGLRFSARRGYYATNTVARFSRGEE